MIFKNYKKLYNELLEEYDKLWKQKEKFKRELESSNELISKMGNELVLIKKLKKQITNLKRENTRLKNKYENQPTIKKLSKKQVEKLKNSMNDIGVISTKNDDNQVEIVSKKKGRK